MDSFVARHAALRILVRVVAIVTFRTVRDIAMFLVVTTLAFLLRVRARELLQLLSWPFMAIGTRLAESVHRRNPQWRVGILMTVNAVNLLWPMLLTVASGTEWHQIVVIIFSRTVGMKDFMTFLAGKAMFATRIFQVCKLANMTLSTFGRLHCRWSHRIKLLINLRQLTLDGGSRPWLGKPSQGSKDNQNESGHASTIRRHEVTSSF